MSNQQPFAGIPFENLLFNNPPLIAQEAALDRPGDLAATIHPEAGKTVILYNTDVLRMQGPALPP